MHISSSLLGLRQSLRQVIGGFCGLYHRWNRLTGAVRLPDLRFVATGEILKGIYD